MAIKPYIIVILGLLSGCGSIRLAPPVKQPMPEGACNLWMQLKTPPLGKKKVHLVTNEVCIQRPKAAIVVRAHDFWITAEMSDPPGKVADVTWSKDDLEDHCVLAKVDDPNQKGDVKSCRWNGVFLDRAPFSIRLWRSDGRDVGLDVSAIRVVLNGETVYLDTSVHSAEAIYEIDGKALTRDAMPHRTQMRLGIFRRSAPLDQALLTAKVSARSRSVAQRLRAGVLAIYETDSAFAALRTHEACLSDFVALTKEHVNDTGTTEVRAAARRTLDALTNLFDTGKCGAATAQYTQIRDTLNHALNTYDDITTHATTVDKDLVNRLAQRIEALLAEAVDAATSALQPTLKSATKKWLASEVGKLPALKGVADDVVAFLSDGRTFPPAGDGPLATLWTNSTAAQDALKGLKSRLDEALKSAAAAASLLARGADLGAQLATDLRETVQATKSSEFAMRSLKTFAKQLPSADRHAVKALPPPIPGESTLAMEYYDPLQLYWLAAWNGVPIGVTANVETEVKPENLIPVIDVAGLRYKCFQTGAGLLYAKETVNDRTGNHFSVQLNLAWRSVKIGGAWQFAGHAEGTDSVDRVRVLVGLDLLKFFVGQAAEYDVTSIGKLDHE